MSALAALFDNDLMLEGYNAEASKAITPVTDELYDNPEEAISDEVTALFSELARTPAPLNKRGAVARVLDQLGRTEKAATMFIQFHQQRFGHDYFVALRDDEQGRTIVSKASREVQFQQQYAAQRTTVTKELSFCQFLSDAKVRYDADTGDIVESGGQVADFNLSDSHRTNLDGIIALAWSDPAAKILDQLEAVRIQAALEGKPRPDTVVLPSDAKKHLRANTQFREWIAASPNMAERMMTGNWLENVGDWNWWFLDHGYKSAVDQTNKLYYPKGKATLLPLADKSWYKSLKGMTVIPTSIEVGSSMANTKDVYGPYAYAQMSHNPIALDSFMGDVWGLIPFDIDAMWIADIYTP